MFVLMVSSQIDILSTSIESYVPDFIRGASTNVDPPAQRSFRPLRLKRVMVAGKHRCKGYAGYLHTIASADAVYVELDVSCGIQLLQKSNVIDLYVFVLCCLQAYVFIHFSETGRTLDGKEISLEWHEDFTKGLRNYVVGLKPPRSITPPPENTTRFTTPPFCSSRSPSPTTDNPATSVWLVTREDLADIADRRRPYGMYLHLFITNILTKLRWSW